jgi:fructose-1,6-bisphosphatase
MAALATLCIGCTNERSGGDDPAKCYVPKGHGLRETILMARMQKAAAIMQFKLEEQTVQRNPEWGLGARRLLHRIDHKAGTIESDGAPGRRQPNAAAFLGGLGRAACPPRR